MRRELPMGASPIVSGSSGAQRADAAIIADRLRSTLGDGQSLLDQALAPIQGDLQRVAERILSELTDLIARRVVYLITAGGKRLRPALVLLAGAIGAAPNRNALIDTAAAVELIHTATLIHDDIIDQSTLRRSQPTFHDRWGTEQAVLMGDYLYATAFTVLSRIDRPFVVRTIADVCRQLCRGELREVDARYRLDLTEAEYLEIIRDKTASLTAGCCRCGASLGGASDDIVERFATFGTNFGLAFQIVDDCLDLVGEVKELGKSIHADLDKGALSLPIIYLSETLSASQREQLFAPLRTQATDPVFLARIAQAAQECGAIVRAQQRAGRFLQIAHEALAGIPLNGLAAAYDLLVQYTVSRRS